MAHSTRYLSTGAPRRPPFSHETMSDAAVNDSGPSSPSVTESGPPKRTRPSRADVDRPAFCASDTRGGFGTARARMM